MRTDLIAIKYIVIIYFMNIFSRMFNKPTQSTVNTPDNTQQKIL